MMRVLLPLCAVLCALPCSLAGTTGIDQVQHIVAGQSQQSLWRASGHGLRQVIRRLSPAIKETQIQRVRKRLPRPSALIAEYGYQNTATADWVESGRFTARLRLSLGPVERALRETGQPIWSVPRKPLLVWVCSGGTSGCQQTLTDTAVGVAPWEQQLLHAVRQQRVHSGMSLLLPPPEMSGRVQTLSREQMQHHARAWGFEDLLLVRIKGYGARGWHADWMLQLQRGRPQYGALYADHASEVLIDVIERALVYMGRYYSYTPVDEWRGNLELRGLRSWGQAKAAIDSLAAVAGVHRVIPVELVGERARINLLTDVPHLVLMRWLMDLGMTAATVAEGGLGVLDIRDM